MQRNFAKSTQMKQTPTILFKSDIPVPASTENHFFLLEEEERRAYREAIVKPSASVLDYPSDFADPDIPEGSIAYHPVFGEITHRSWWRFSTARFMDDLKAAEENPSIVAHLLHIDSGGGEAFFLHEAFEQVKALTKPCYALIESVCGSAAYYLAAAADKIYTSAIFSLVGCIGIAGVIYDDRKAWDKMGVSRKEMISNYSPLKNKLALDARDGDTDEYIRRYLDPMALQFIEDVKSVRKGISEAALQGDTFYSAEAMANGLIDGENSLEEVLDLLMKEVRPEQQSPSVDINTLKLD